jgi:hypothetical protein
VKNIRRKPYLYKNNCINENEKEEGFTVLSSNKDERPEHFDK